MRNMLNHLDKLRNIHDLSSFYRYFMREPIEVQIVVGMVVFGLLTLVYIFFVALFSDKGS